MTDQVTIYNMALDAMGSRSTISSPNETSAEAKALNRHWLPAIEQLLRAVHWNFARYQVALTLLKDGGAGDAVPTPWLYEYAYPSDCMLGRYVMPSFQSTPGVTPAGVTVPYYLGPTVRFIVGSDNDAGGNPINVILTNQQQAELVYTRRIVNPQLFDPEFVNGLTLYLAHRVSIPLSGDKATAKMNFDLAMSAINQARARNGNEGVTVHDHAPEWLRVRGWANDWAYPDGSLFFYAPQNLAMIM